MTKQTKLIASIVIAIIIVAVAGILYASASKNNGGSASTVKLDRWGVQFDLPKDIDASDVKVVYKKTSTDDQAFITSPTLQSKLNKEACSGEEIENGEFLSISRGGSASAIKINGNKYDIYSGLATSSCYDGTTYQKYFGSDVKQTARQTLRAE